MKQTHAILKTCNPLSSDDADFLTPAGKVPSLEQEFMKIMSCQLMGKL